MLKILLLIKFAILSSTLGCDVQAFRSAKIFPDIIDEFEFTQMLNVTFLVPLTCGNQLTPNEVINEPEVMFSAKDGEFYSMLMTDGGVHSEGNVLEIRHWLVMNIPSNDVSKGEKIVEYVGAMPMEVEVIFFIINFYHNCFYRIQDFTATSFFFSSNRMAKSIIKKTSCLKIQWMVV